MNYTEHCYPNVSVPDENGYGIAYYGMATTTIAGHQVVVSKFEADQIKMSVDAPLAEVPAFITAMHAEVEYGTNGLVTNVYVSDKTHLMAVCEELAKSHASVRVYAKARFLAMWFNGELTHGPVNLDHYYTDMTAEQLEACKL